MKAKILFSIIALSLAGTGIAAGLIATDHNHDDGNYHHPGEPMTSSHSGGLDQCGGHYDRRTGTYHYHRTPRC